MQQDVAFEIKVNPEYTKGEFKDFGYNRCLKIVLFGEPIADSRPRVTGSGAVAVINLQKLKARFKPLYQSSELLQNLMIHSQYHIKFKIYMSTTQKDLRFIKKDRLAFLLYKKDRLPDMNIKDVDNTVKVHNDLLFCKEYRITVDDAYNIGLITPEKFTSSNPRIEMEVYWTDKPNKWQRYKIENSTKYFEHMISYKYMKICGRNSTEQTKYLKKLMNGKIELEKKEKDIVKLIKKLAEVLEEYPADVLKEMAQMEVSRKFTKYDAAVKVIILILSKHKSIVKTLTGLGGDDFGC